MGELARGSYRRPTYEELAAAVREAEDTLAQQPRGPGDGEAEHEVWLRLRRMVARLDEAERRRRRG